MDVSCDTFQNPQRTMQAFANSAENPQITRLLHVYRRDLLALPWISESDINIPSFLSRRDTPPASPAFPALPARPVPPVSPPPPPPPRPPVPLFPPVLPVVRVQDPILPPQIKKLSDVLQSKDWLNAHAREYFTSIFAGLSSGYTLDHESTILLELCVAETTSRACRAESAESGGSSGGSNNTVVVPQFQSLLGTPTEAWLVQGVREARDPVLAVLWLSALRSFAALALGDEQPLPGEHPHHWSYLCHFAALLDDAAGSPDAACFTYSEMGRALLRAGSVGARPFVFVHASFLETSAAAHPLFFGVDEQYWAARMEGHTHGETWSRFQGWLVQGMRVMLGEEFAGRCSCSLCHASVRQMV